MDFSAAMLGFKQFQLCFAAIKLDLPKHLSKGPLRPDQLSDLTKTPVDRLGRLLRALVWCEVLKQLDDGSYALAAAGSELVDDRPLGLAEDIRFHGEFLYHSYGRLEQYLRSGEVPFERAHGIGIFDYLARHSELAETYTAPMAEWSKEVSATVAAHPALADAMRITDIAGGTGRLLIDILNQRTNARGVIVDLPYMQTRVTETIAAEGLASRCAFQAGDIFNSVPGGADVYLLKWILHDFSDEESVRILRNIATAMSGESRLLIVERLLPESISPETELVEGDLNMLCLSGGTERTIEEYRRLCEKAGLKLADSTRIDRSDGFHVMEVIRRESI